MHAVSEKRLQILHIDIDEEVHRLVEMILPLNGISSDTNHARTRLEAFHYLADTAKHMHPPYDAVLLGKTATEIQADNANVTKIVERISNLRLSTFIVGIAGAAVRHPGVNESLVSQPYSELPYVLKKLR